jgi:hypothetical protein
MKRPAAMQKSVRQKRENRVLACSLAASVMSGPAGNRDDLMPITWSLCVFFERYIEKGSTGTMREFGPKKPVNLRDVRAARECGDE